MLGQQSSLRWKTCGSSTRNGRVVAGQARSVVSTGAYKRNKRPGFADAPPYPNQGGGAPNYPLPPLNGAPSAPPQQQQQAQAPPNGAPPPQPLQAQPPPQQQQQQQQPIQRPPSARPGFQSPPPAQRAAGGAQKPGGQQMGTGYMNPNPAQTGFTQQQGFAANAPAAAPAAAPAGPQAPAAPLNPQQGGWQQGLQQQQGFQQQQQPQQQGWQNPPQQQADQGGYQQQQQGGGYYQQQQPGGYQGGYQNAPPAQQQPQQWSQGGGGGYVDEGTYLNDQGYMDQNGVINPGDVGGYINSPPQRAGWSQQGNTGGGYRNNNRQQQQQQQQQSFDYGQQGGYMNDTWGQQQQRGRQNFSGFVDPPGPGAWTEDYLLQQLDMRMPQNYMPMEGWVEEVEEVEDLTPKYVNGKRVLVNSEIRAAQLRVQDSSKAELGVMSYDDARDLANRQDVDVVMINDGADPPVVRLVAFSKYKYELEKTAKQKQKASKGPEIKEVKLRPVTEKADYDTKIRQAQKFLSKGAKVKLTMTFSGREMRFKDQGKEMMLKLIEELAEVSKMEAPLALRPSNFSVTLVPLK